MRGRQRRDYALPWNLKSAHCPDLAPCLYLEPRGLYNSVKINFVFPGKSKSTWQSVLINNCQGWWRSDKKMTGYCERSAKAE